MELKAKCVSYAPVPLPIQPCCEAARGKTIQALMCIRATEGGSERGYALHSEFCECDDRWISHDWSKGHAEFVSVHPVDKGECPNGS